MSLLYENNLLNDFLHRINPVDFASPMCRCETDRETAHHILFHCPLVDADIRKDALNKFKEICGDSAYCNSYISLLNASRNREFMAKIAQILGHQIRNNLRTSRERPDNVLRDLILSYLHSTPPYTHHTQDTRLFSFYTSSLIF